MGSQIKLLFIAAGITTVLGVSGAWSTWVPGTLIKGGGDRGGKGVIMKNLSIERVTYGYVRD